MAALAGHITKLEAVNDMLLSIGEDPVNSLSSGLADAELAERVLDRTSRRIQLKGWHANTLIGYEISRNASNQIPLPVDTLKVDTVNRSSSRQIATPPQSGFINAVMKRSADDTLWLLFDVDNNTEFWASNSSLTVQLTQLVEFANLSPALQHYVSTQAARTFQQGVMGSRVLWEFTQTEVDEAMTDALQEDTENKDANIISGNPHSYNIAYRNNPLFGK